MKTRIYYLGAIAATLFACSSPPKHNSALDQARDRYASAQADSQVIALAPNELKKAGESLRLAEKAWKDRDKKVDVDHLAYLAEQRTVIAQETAASLAAQAVVASAAAERDKIRLEVRTKEAEAAQQQLERSDARVDDLEAQLNELNAKKTDRGMVLTLGGVLFNTGKSTLLPGASRNLSKLVEFFIRNPQSRASIEGHTDSVGSESMNYDLSSRRANAVMSALVNMGVPADRLSVRAFGEEMPIADNATAAGRQMNRRVEIVFSQAKADAAAR